ncbi:acyl-[acyl-carrier-protein] thioesterase [Mailhella sp.]|uniref:acyl-[acyl-carrier-protein] thioesterase n=1 Tax=Mailhella sp. TaxID=1981029 RepID=UPI003AB63687
MSESPDFTLCAIDIHFSVRYGEIGENGVATLSALGNWLQEAAGVNADSLGFGENNLLRYNLTWVLTRLVLRIARLPHAGEKLRIHTWPSTFDHFGHRGYEVYDENDRLIVSGGSAWSVMNLADRSMAQLPEELAPRYPSAPRPCAPFCGRVIPRLRGEHPSKSLLRVRKDDLDINGHVNNTRYLAWILEPLPPSSTFGKKQCDPLMPMLVDITFRAECFPQEELRCLCAPAPLPIGAETTLFGRPVSCARLHSIQRISDGNEVCRALTLWERDPEENHPSEK